jgi:plasmid rolling circle replication initiator protein Rep
VLKIPYTGRTPHHDQIQGIIMSGDRHPADGIHFRTSILAPNSETSTNTPALSDVSERDKPWDVHKAESDRIESFYKGSDFNQLAVKIHFCAELLDFRLTPTNHGELKLKLAAARFCRVRTCMICTWRKSLRWKAKAYASLPRFLKDYPGYRFLFITLTVKNCEIYELKKTLVWMNQSFTKLTRLKVFPGVGWIKSVEVTRGRKGDAHPHFHILAATKSTYFGRNYLSQDKWVELWKQCLRVDYNPILDIQALKAKGSLLGLIAEVIKYQTKPTNLLYDREWFLEYTRQIYNTKSISVGGIFRDYFRQLEDEPEDLIGNDEEGEVNDEDVHLYFDWRRTEKRYRMIDQ